MARKLSATLATAFVAAIVLGLTGCGGDTSAEEAEKLAPRPVPAEKLQAPGPGSGGLEAQGEEGSGGG